MPATPINDLLTSLTVAISAAAGLPMANAPRSLWMHDAIETDSNTVYTVLRIYGGEEPGNFAGMRRPVISVQADTRGTDSQLVLAQAWRLHESLLNDDGTPWLGKLIDKKTLDSDQAIQNADPAGQWSVWVMRFSGTPQMVGRDDDDRWMATENFDLQFSDAGDA